MKSLVAVSMPVSLFLSLSLFHFLDLSRLEFLLKACTLTLVRKNYSLVTGQREIQSEHHSKAGIMLEVFPQNSSVV